MDTPKLAVLTHGRVTLRPHRRGDADGWSKVRLANEDWLAPWEPNGSVPWEQRHQPSQYRTLYRALRSALRAGTLLPFVIEVDGRFAGQLSFANVVRGALGSTSAGYWMDSDLAGLGLMPIALALGVDYTLGPARLHRVEVNIQPENRASRRVVEKLGFREEGLHRNYMFVAGEWRDHINYALTVEDLPESGLLSRIAARDRR